MNAKETKLQDIIQGDKQFVVPLFQRTYSWELKQWETLWNDIFELYESDEPNPADMRSKTHFMGSVVNFPVNSVPEGISKFLLIDGQQRLTSILILLIAVRNLAKNSKNEEEQQLADEIHQMFITNYFKRGTEHFKILPTQADRQYFEALVNEKSYSADANNKIIKAYEYFALKVKKIEQLEKIKNIVASKLSLVSITLDPDDNPYLVFESLNSKGAQLLPADLIRNHFFMCIHTDKQDGVYHELWKPMQDRLDKSLTDFIKHFLMREGGGFIKESEIYGTLKKKVNPFNAEEKLTELARFSVYYHRFLQPEFEPNLAIRKYLKRLNRIDVTTSFPLLLNFYHAYENREIDANVMTEVLKVMENYLIRRAVCNRPSNQLNKIFPELFKSIREKYSDNLLLGLKQVLLTKNYPKDAEFHEYIAEGRANFYGGAPLNSRTQFILESIEESFQHKEQIDFETHKFSIEHILPQNIENSTEWKNALGENWENVHELYQHHLGNLSLTAYNSELSNDIFEKKKETLAKSHLEINSYFEKVEQWNQEEIEKRAEVLANRCLKIWEYFGAKNEPETNKEDITGTTPTGLWVMSEYFQVQSWRDVLAETLNTIALLAPEKFEFLARKHSRFLAMSDEKFKSSRLLKNNYRVNVGLSAKDVQRFCYQAIESVGLTAEDWRVEYI